MSRPRSRSPPHRPSWRPTDPLLCEAMPPVNGGHMDSHRMFSRSSQRSERRYWEQSCSSSRGPGLGHHHSSDQQREPHFNRTRHSQSEERRRREHRFRKEDFQEPKDQVFSPREHFQGMDECGSVLLGCHGDPDYRDPHAEPSHWEGVLESSRDREWLYDHDQESQSHSQGDHQRPHRAYRTRSSYRGGPRSHRGRGFRNQYFQYRVRTQPSLDQQSEQYEEPLMDRPRYRPHEDDSDWSTEQNFQAEDFYGPEQTEDPFPNPDPKVPRSRQLGWSGPSQAEQETLTIKVDMSCPARRDSLPPSSARQLSMDLVHVGRQRLDLLSDESGTGESATHTGTFAQEVITLLHQVKDQYFRGRGLTLNQRFSAAQRLHPQEGELTLNKRFSSNRGFSSNMKDRGLLFTNQRSSQLLRGDLRLDLEKKRQEKHEDVKITIIGAAQSVGCVIPEAQTDSWKEISGRRPWKMGYSRGRSFPFRNSFSRGSSST
ncbi:BCLAF1 and THRAP3 family member 3 [Gouania willdenowi]|uniref:BCLAF1 and THRAP3 family member 3 n=1 Tax=Gouania willdenowi TaxID=441366 RepID=A0A8C5DST9_GOUWI|nr:BCLAF1 and THRAP3 family member 3 [Gouania willdenowi]XP_028290279.1 BCLAF1 and THRAP3 family member 3 [Gouania willdenowi]